jgi:hypothetical protein
VKNAIDDAKPEPPNQATNFLGPVWKHHEPQKYAQVLSTEKYGDQYHLIIELLPAEFLGPFERLRFKRNPHCGSYGTSLTKSWLMLVYRKDPGFKAGEAFPLRRAD